MPSASITGSHAHRTVVTPASFSWATMFDAWFGIEEMSSLYFMFMAIGSPAAFALRDEGVHRLLVLLVLRRDDAEHARLALDRGAGVVGVRARWQPARGSAAALDSTTLVPSGKRLHE